MSEESDKKLILDNVSLIVNNKTEDDGSFIDEIRSWYSYEEYSSKKEQFEKVIIDIQTPAGYTDDCFELIDTYTFSDSDIESMFWQFALLDYVFIKDKSYLDTLDKTQKIKHYDLYFESELFNDGCWNLSILVTNNEIIGWGFHTD